MMPGLMMTGLVVLRPTIPTTNGAGITFTRGDRGLTYASGLAPRPQVATPWPAQLFEPLQRHDMCIDRDDTAICGADTASDG